MNRPPLHLAQIVIRDSSAYGFSGYALLSDGTTAFPTQKLHATREEAEAEVAATALERLGPPLGGVEWSDPDPALVGRIRARIHGEPHSDNPNAELEDELRRDLDLEDAA